MLSTTDSFMVLTEKKILEWLEEVKDPEIPVLSITDLGIITEVDITGGSVKIEITPTFVGCPALEMMRNEIIEVLHKNGVCDVQVNVSFRKPWTSDRISEKGKESLKKFGLSPPPEGNLFTDIDLLEHAVCPRCNSDNTELKNPFGPTLCRSIHYCNTCKEAFEQFKPL